MTGLLSRAAGWLVEPPDPALGAPGAPPSRPDGAEPEPRGARSAPAPDARRFLPPVASPVADPSAIREAAAETEANPALAAVRAPISERARTATPEDRASAPHAAPPDGTVRDRRRRRTAPAAERVRAVALGPPADVPVVAAALALDLCRAQRAATALVLVCGGDARRMPPAAAAPAFPAARRLAARLTRRGVEATARGRLVWVPFPLGAETAAARAEAAAGDLPTVLAIAGPREPAADALIAGRAPVVIAAEPESPLAALAAADLGVPVRAWTPPPPGPARLAILAGLRGPSCLEAEQDR